MLTAKWVALEPDHEHGLIAFAPKGIRKIAVVVNPFTTTMRFEPFVDEVAMDFRPGFVISLHPIEGRLYLDPILTREEGCSHMVSIPHRTFSGVPE
jgi:hypothetical protein